MKKFVAFALSLMLVATISTVCFAYDPEEKLGQNIAEINDILEEKFFPGDIFRQECAQIRNTTRQILTYVRSNYSRSSNNKKKVMRRTVAELVFLLTNESNVDYINRVLLAYYTLVNA